MPIPLRYWMASSQDLTTKVHTIIRTTIGQCYVNQAVTQSHERANVHPGSVTFIQRFGSALNLNLHFHCVFLEGVYLDRTAGGLKPRFLAVEPPSITAVAAVVQKISRRVIHKLRRLGYLETGMEAPVVRSWCRRMPRILATKRCAQGILLWRNIQDRAAIGYVLRLARSKRAQQMEFVTKTAVIQKASQLCCRVDMPPCG